MIVNIIFFFLNIIFHKNFSFKVDFYIKKETKLKLNSAFYYAKH